MGTKTFAEELPVHQGTVEGWTTNIIDALKGQNNGLAPLGADGLIPSQHLPNISLSWGNISGTLADQTDLITALGAKASTDSPAFTGTPTAPNPLSSDDSIRIATTAWARQLVAGEVGAIPMSSISATPTLVTGDISPTDISGKYFVCSIEGITTITLPDATSFNESAFTFLVNNTSNNGYILIRDLNGDFIGAVPPLKIYVYSVNDNTSSSGYALLTELSGVEPVGVMTPMIDVYKTSITTSSVYSYSYTKQIFEKIELEPNKWFCTYTPVSSDTYTYAVIMTLSNGVYSFGTPVDISQGGTYGGHNSWLQKADGTLVAFGLMTGDGANYVQSATISGTTITLGTLTAVQSSTATYQSDTTKGHRLDDTRSLVYYVDSSAGDPSVKVITVNGSGWSLGAEYTIATAGSLQEVVKISDTEFVAFYYYTFCRVKKLTVSGTTVTMGAEQQNLIDSTTTLYTAVQTKAVAGFPMGTNYVVALHASGSAIIMHYALDASGVWTELGKVEYETASNITLAVHKISETRLFTISGDGDGTVYPYNLKIIDLVGNTPTITATIPISRTEAFEIERIHNIQAQSGDMSIAFDVADGNTTNKAGSVELSLGGITL